MQKLQNPQEIDFFSLFAYYVNGYPVVLVFNYLRFSAHDGK
ncbi:MAG: hypothetical protein US52_C0066G0004 [candidate division WS6 bacterium GW2011_GWA2_37_6]|uniref:Uncharacterized protein n=1 Tax=candidate division WS6 bacterium GW2011_GWA2_37_6 TaxID=1619087 RepID=A0A0G0JBT0_9BACT|nr:MAG: hypothetical protein US52_C0066G0004 [candidate division WS6 bacterium GW2011_GWA2_37_6]